MLEHIWHWYLEVNRWRGVSHQGGPMPLTLENVSAWASLTGHKVTSLELQLFHDLESVFWTAMHTESSAYLGGEKEVKTTDVGKQVAEGLRMLMSGKKNEGLRTIKAVPRPKRS